MAGPKVCIVKPYNAPILCTLSKEVGDTQSGHSQSVLETCSLIPRHPDLFNVARKKEGEPGKTDPLPGGTNFHIWHDSK